MQSHCLLPQTHQQGLTLSFLELLSLGSVTDCQSSLTQEAGQVCKVLFTM